MQKINVGVNEANQRLDKLLHKYMQLAGNGFIYKMLRKKNIVLNGKKANGTEILKEGDVLTLYMSDETIAKFQKQIVMPKNYPEPDIIYEDKNVLILNKPCGMLSQKSDNDDVSMIDVAIAYLVANGSIDIERLSSFRPGICNRLDRNTSGIVVVGKTLNALQVCNKLIADKDVKKYYLTVVDGIINDKMNIKGYLLKDDLNNRVEIFDKPIGLAKYIETSYEPICHTEKETVLMVELHTGRSHQIRAHLAYIGHPVIGDRKYNLNARGDRRIKHQLLHSYKMIFPEDKRLGELSGRTITAPLPKAFDRFMG